MERVHKGISGPVFLYPDFRTVGSLMYPVVNYKRDSWKERS